MLLLLLLLLFAATGGSQNRVIRNFGASRLLEPLAYALAKQFVR
jgi:hypothetical protein